MAPYVKVPLQGNGKNFVERRTLTLLQARVWIDLREFLRIRDAFQGHVQLRLLDHFGEHELIGTRGCREVSVAPFHVPMRGSSV